MADSILVSDFDGTVTGEDFFQLVVSHLLTPKDMKPWDEYLEGRLTHLEALQRIFSKIQAPESDVLALLEDMRPDPAMSKSLGSLRAAGWEVIIASNGCDWYIRRILEQLGVHVELHANPGTYAEDGPLIMKAPVDSRFYSPEGGIDKAAIVRFHQERGARVAFAGDGYTDQEAALLVPPQLRFARAALAAVLRTREEPFQPFSVWSDIGRTLLSRGNG